MRSGKTWVASDLHLGHQGICEFTRFDEVTPLRPWDRFEEMDEALIDNWNSVVNDLDRVYLLGDVTFSAVKMKKYVPRLKGKICLVPGNHEPTKMRKYFDLFDDVRGYVVKKGLIMSHIPLHPIQTVRFGLNVHGHLHAGNVLLENGEKDPRYFCVCMEQIGYTPLDMQVIYDVVHERMKEREKS